MNILLILSKIKYWVEHKICLIQLNIKWLHDRGCLPLAAAHHELYTIIHLLCWQELGEFPNLIVCRDYNDRIQWLKLFDQSRETIRCSDKILVRDYIQERIGDQYLVKLYQVHDHFNQIDFDTLPDSFVIKTNHDSGTVVLVRDKLKLDFQAIEGRIEASLKQPYGWLSGEWAYSYIEPRVLVEEFIAPKSQNTPPDYKFHCVNGKVCWLQYIYDRGNSTKESIIQPDGVVTPIHFDFNMIHREEFNVPDSWVEMRSVVERLAAPFKYVRVDMYYIENKIYVGELTFYPLMGCYKGDGQKQLGRFLDFDRGSIKPLLIPELEKTRSRFSIYSSR